MHNFFLYVKFFKNLSVIADALHAQCMRNILTAISSDDLVKLLEKSQEHALSCSTGVDEDASGKYGIFRDPCAFASVLIES